jgi:uncharacterized membrane protein YgcG
MKCPSCTATLTAPLPECPFCGLTVDSLDVRFGALPRQMQFFTDRSSSLPLNGMNEIRALLGIYARRFPQSRLSVFVLPEVKNGTIAEYIFWLGNRGRFNPDDPFGGDNFDLLLGIDLKGRQAALLAGYGLEQYLGDEDLTEILAQSAPRFAANDFIGGLRDCIELLMTRLRDVALRVEREEREQSRHAPETAEEISI